MWSWQASAKHRGEHWGSRRTSRQNLEARQIQTLDTLNISGKALNVEFRDHL